MPRHGPPAEHRRSPGSRAGYYRGKAKAKAKAKTPEKPASPEARPNERAPLPAQPPANTAAGVPGPVAAGSDRAPTAPPSTATPTDTSAAPQELPAKA